MRLAFHHYFRATEAELVDLWQNGLFTFDASVLLNIYGYSSDTRDELVKVIQRNAERVRLPHQFGLEFARNRSKVIMRQVSNYESAERELDQIRKTHIAPKRDHPYLSKDSLNAYQAIQAELRASRKAIERLIGSDPYADRILAVFEGRVGQAPTPEELAQLHANAKERFERRVPPGFMDLKEKDLPEAYGDFVGWHQILQIAEAEHKGMVLVIDDFKEDWWQIERGRTVGPRPELLEEFGRATRQRMCMYTSEGFLRAARKYLAAEIGEDVIEEIRERLADQRESERTVGPKPLPREPRIDKATGAAGALSDKPRVGLKPLTSSAGGESDKPDAQPEGSQ